MGCIRMYQGTALPLADGELCLARCMLPPSMQAILVKFPPHSSMAKAARVGGFWAEPKRVGEPDKTETSANCEHIQK